MGESLQVGIESTTEFDVDGGLLTDVGGTIPASVLSTPGMIAMMERTASMLAYPRLEPGQATVGFEVCVKHVAAALQGHAVHSPRPARGDRRRPQAPVRGRGRRRGRSHDRGRAATSGGSSRGWRDEAGRRGGRARRPCGPSSLPRAPARRCATTGRHRPPAASEVLVDDPERPADHLAAGDGSVVLARVALAKDGRTPVPAPRAGRRRQRRRIAVHLRPEARRAKPAAVLQPGHAPPV